MPASGAMPSIVIKRSVRTVVRCDKNQFKTPLFSYDSQGLYFRCKDCRSLDSETHVMRRGAFHVIAWADIERLKLGLVRPEEVLKYGESGTDSGGSHNSAEKQTDSGGGSHVAEDGGGDKRG